VKGLALTATRAALVARAATAKRIERFMMFSSLP
jgi:hypothetical protein